MTLQINTSTGARDLTTNEQAEARAGLGAAAAADLSAHSSSASNPHSVTKAQVGLGSVENTADADKPVSTAQATAIGAAVTAHIDATDPHPDKYAAADHTHTPDSIGAATAAQGATADAALQPGPQLTQAAVTAATAPGVALLGAATAAGQRTALGLGTAATTAASDYATAAQGGKADAAMVASADAIADVLEAAATGAPADLARIQSSVSGDRTRKIMRTDTPSTDSVAGTNTIVPFGLLGQVAATGFTKLVVVSSKKPFTTLQLGYIHVGGGGAATVRMAVASTDDPGPLNYALGGSNAELKKCVSPRKSGVVYNTYSANGWQRVSFGGASSDVTAATVPDTGSNASCSILMSDMTPCVSVAAADGLHYALIRVDDGAGPSTRAGIGYTGVTTGTQYQDDAGFAKVFSVFRGVAGVADPSLWPADYTVSFADTAQCPIVVRFGQGSIDGDMPVTGLLCGDSRFDATGGTDATAQYRGTAFLLAQSLNAAGKNHHMIRACGGGYTSATYYDRGSKILAVASPAWAMYTVYTVNDGVPTQAIIDAAKLRAQQFVRLCAAKNIRVGLVTAYPRTGMTAPEMALLTVLDAWATATGLPYYSPLAAYGTAAGEWRPGTNIDSNHMTAAQYRVYAADLHAWLLTWSGI